MSFFIGLNGSVIFKEPTNVLLNHTSSVVFVNLHGNLIDEIVYKASVWKDGTLNARTGPSMLKYVMRFEQQQPANMKKRARGGVAKKRGKGGLEKRLKSPGVSG